MRTLLQHEIPVVCGGELTNAENCGVVIGGLAGGGVLVAMVTGIIPLSHGVLIKGFLYSCLGFGAVLIGGGIGYGIAAAGGYLLNRN